MTLTIGAYTACLHHLKLEQALDVLKGMGLSGAEINVGGFIPPPHAHVDLLLNSELARSEYLGVFKDKGMKLSGFNTSGNPLSPFPGQGVKHDDDLRNAIELAGKLGVEEIVCMSGAPGSDPYAKYPSWVVNPWDGVYGKVLDYQWSVVIPYWKEMNNLAADNGVKLALELHPHNVVFTPVSFLRFAEEIDATNVGVNMDPSHLMWQGMDILESIRELGSHIFHVHAKDTAIEPGVATRGVLDAEFERVPATAENKTPTGIGSWCNAWPSDPAWRFVALGEGNDAAGNKHDVKWWAEFLREIEKINPDMNVNIEHEDANYGAQEGLEISARNLLAAQDAKEQK